MYLAHSGVALGGTKADPRVPLVWWLAAAWAFDLTGIGHWIPFGAVLAVLAYRLGRSRWGTNAGIALAAVVLSHDLLDLVVGVQLWPTGPYLGWNLEVGGFELVLEVTVLVVGGATYASTLPSATRFSPPVVLALVLLLATSLVVSGIFRPGQDEPSPLGLAAMATGAVVTSVVLVRADRAARRAE